jgi:hypothetical protein
MDIRDLLLPLGMEWWRLPVMVVALVLLALVAGLFADWCYAVRARRR